MRTVAAAEQRALASASAGAEITTRSEPVEHDASSRAVPGNPGGLRAWGVWGPCRGPPLSDASSRAVPGFPGRLRAWGVWGPCRGPHSVVERQRGEQRDHERGVGERDRRALPGRQRLVARNGIAPPPHQREEAD